MTSGATCLYIYFLFLFFSYVNFYGGYLVLVGLSGKVEAVLLFSFFSPSAFLSSRLLLNPGLRFVENGLRPARHPESYMPICR